MKVQIELLSGKQLKAVQITERFPCLIGRASSVDLRLEEAGVWDRHLELRLQHGEGIIMKVLPGALATVNGEQAERVVLRNGDLIEAGAARMRFWLGPTHQRRYGWREAATWLALVALCALQIVLIYRLLP